MRPEEALAVLQRMGLSLASSGDHLSVAPRDRITPEARALIVEHRDQLLRLVRSGQLCGEMVSALVAARTWAPFDTPSRPSQSKPDRNRIHAAIDRLPLRSNSGIDLLHATRGFLDSKWFENAVAMGFRQLELFGIDPAKSNAPGEWGLVVTLALLSRGAKIQSITEERATFGRAPSEHCIWPRFRLAIDDSVLWWECPDIIADDDSDTA